MSARAPEANGWSPASRRVSEIVQDLGSSPRLPHIPLSAEKQFGKAGWVGSRSWTTYNTVKYKGGNQRKDKRYPGFRQTTPKVRLVGFGYILDTLCRKEALRFDRESWPRIRRERGAAPADRVRAWK